MEKKPYRKDFQRQQTIESIELHIRKVKTTVDERVKELRISKTCGILNLAKLLEIITLEEYEHYFEELFK